VARVNKIKKPPSLEAFFLQSTILLLLKKSRTQADLLGQDHSPASGVVISY
jgi:hypothetical protein